LSGSDATLVAPASYERGVRLNDTIGKMTPEDFRCQH
jgi:hypothetical protein